MSGNQVKEQLNSMIRKIFRIPDPSQPDRYAQATCIENNEDNPVPVKIIMNQNRVREKLIVTDGSPILPPLLHEPLAGTVVEVFYNGVLMDEGGTNDFTITGKVITFNYNLRNSAPQYGKVAVFYVQDVLT